MDDKGLFDYGDEYSYLKNAHAIEFHHFTSGSMSFEGTLHECPVPELVHDHRWTRVDLEDLQSKTARKSCRENLVGRVYSFFSRVVAPELVRQRGLQQ